jgi:hypothetical protein
MDMSCENIITFSFSKIFLIFLTQKDPPCEKREENLVLLLADAKIQIYIFP